MPNATVDAMDGDPGLSSRPVGGRASVASAFEAHHAEIYSFARRATGDPVAAEDLVQEAFLRLTVESRGGRAPDNVRAWLYRVASNLAISRGRRRSTVARWLAGQTHQNEAARVTESPETGVLRREQIAGLEAALAGLPADARTALLLSGEGFSGEEIAAAIGRSHAATRTLLSRARVRVRLQLEQAEVRP